MATWFFDSFGEPIAFVGMNNLVFHESGTFIGLLVEGKIWNKQFKYVGDVIDDRLFRDKITVHLPNINVYMLPYEPNIPSLPASHGRKPLPPGFEDVEFDNEGYVVL